MVMRHVLIWLAIIFTGIYFFTILSSIMLPFFIGFTIAYLFSPLVNLWVQFGLPRLLATTMIVFICVCLFFLFLLILLPLIMEQVIFFIHSVPNYVDRLNAWVVQIDESERLVQFIDSVSDMFLSNVANITHLVFLNGLSFLHIISLIFITPIVTFYILNDWDSIVENIHQYLPIQKVPTIHYFIEETDNVLKGFIRGQLLVCIFLGSFYALGLGLLGLHGGVTVGILAGGFSFIPYFGTILGIGIAMLLSVVQYGVEWGQLIPVICVFLVGQFIEGNFLTPRIVGDRVGLHPVWIIFSLLAFGTLLGFIGLLLAVPIAAIIGIIVRYWLRIYKEKFVTLSPVHMKNISE